MPNNTVNYNLKKPLSNENYNIQDQNDNMDAIDSALKGLDTKFEDIEVPVTSVSGKTGDVVLAAEDVGAETPTGAQAKVDALAGEGNTKTVKQLDAALLSHEADIAKLAKYRLNQGAHQSIADNNATTLALAVKEAFNGENFTDLTVDNEIKILEAGVYQIIITVEFMSNASGYRQLVLLANSSPKGRISQNATNGALTDMQLITTINASSNTLLSVLITQNSGGALNVIADNRFNYVIIKKVG